MAVGYYEGMEKKGMVLRLERSSVFDGDGFRTVVFMKGCPLRCQWCSTPESQSHAVEKTKEGIVYGSEKTVEEVLTEVRKDVPFYFHSGGGMTISGGELLCQPDFVRCLLKRAQWECIDTAIETTFFAPWDTVSSILPYVNTAFVDLKFVSEGLHEKYCGVSNQQILENLNRTNELEDPFRLIVRMPLIPGVNDAEEELRRIGAFLRNLSRLEHIQLLPYHKLGTNTYKKLGRPYLLPEVIPPDAGHMEHCRSIVGEYVKAV